VNRRDFAKQTALVGFGLGIWPQLLVGCKKDKSWEINFSGKVIVVGGGAAGLMAGFYLKRFGIDFELLEAGSDIGGRTKKTDSFADFPIDLGAEWLHTGPKIFGNLFDNNGPSGSMEVIPYTPATISVYKNGELKQRNIRSYFYGEYKFKRSTWYDFLNSYVAAAFHPQIKLNTVIQSIDYSGSKVVLKDQNQVEYTADKVLVTIPSIKLKTNSVTWNPALPSSFTTAIGKTYMPAGIKVFLQFSEKFYPDVTDLDGENDAETIYYNATFKKESNQHVLALFTIGPRAKELNTLGDHQLIIKDCIRELDEIFGGSATGYFIKGVVQDWTAEEYIGGSYTFFNGREKDIQADLSMSVNDKVFFAGEALHSGSSATVHGAALGGKEEIKKILALS
tara:strand:- start:7473 stop:8651 length:1179 start_codon:yes stop_codon:yes gene_type:complete